MTFAVSPGVSFNEFDLTLTVPAIAATPAAFVGIFLWGPFSQPVLLGSQLDLVKRFYQPSNLNGETWFTAFSYLAYGDELWLVRAGDVTGNVVQHVYANTANSMTAGNTVVLLDNTQGITIGMKLFFANGTALSPLQTNGVYVNQVNTTSVILSSAPSANQGNTLLIFRSNIFYTGIAQENQQLNLHWPNYNVLNQNNYYNVVANTFDPSILWVAKFPGAVGNSLRVHVCDTPSQWSSNVNLAPNSDINSTASMMVANVGSNVITFTVIPTSPTVPSQVVSANAAIGLAWGEIAVGDLIQTGNTAMGFQFLQATQINPIALNGTGNVFSFTVNTDDPYTLIANTQSNTMIRFWEHAHLVGVPPGQSQYILNNGNTSAYDQLHVVITDEDGLFSGNNDEVLEVYTNLSRATDAQALNGTSTYYANVINTQSNYLWFANDRSTAKSANAAQIASSTATAPLSIPLVFGDDGLGEGHVSIGTIANGWNYFKSPEDIDIGLVLTGKNLGTPFDGNTQLGIWLINNISAARRDCVTFMSPDISSVVNNAGNEASTLVTIRNQAIPSSSYGFMDSGYKWMYDQFNNQYRWVPLNGDIAGLAAQVDHTNDPWWSFAGFNRGNIKNLIRLAWNPKEVDRDQLYPAGINPVVSFPGLGTILYGDKTLFAEPSAFNRINVRRLFIVLEKSISTASKFMLFEFNDSFTRSMFVSMVNPFLANVKSLRGIINYLVRCDATNNTAWVIQNNQFVADIFIQPNYSINWIKLNFVNVPPTVSFTEAESIQY